MNIAPRLKLEKRREEILIFLLVLFSVAIGINISVDMEFAKYFFDPTQSLNPWPDKNAPVWRFFYHAAPIITGAILLPSIAIYVFSYLNRSVAKYRRHAAYIFLAALLGPGILINTIFKPYWGRPRPRQVMELGGTEKMNAFWEKGKAGNGYSFPCGHSSVGFALISFYYILKRRKPKTAKVVFAGSFALGMVMGVGRMADGAHFFSDVFWSAVMSYIPAHFLYYKMRLYEDYNKDFKKEYKKALVQGGVLFVALVFAVAVATPYGKNRDFEFDSQTISLVVQEGTVDFLQQEDSDFPLIVKVKARGFGFPKSELLSTKTEKSISFLKKGFFSDFEANYIVIFRSDVASVNLVISDKVKLKKPNPIPAVKN